jgi:hypothetical protein
MDQPDQNTQDVFDFVEEDVKDPVSLGAKLCHGEDAASRHFRSLIAAPVLSEIEAGLLTGGPELRTRLVVTLNYLLDLPELFDTFVAEKVRLIDLELQLQSRRADLSARDRAHCNRRILQESYPDEITALAVEVPRPRRDEVTMGPATIGIGGSVADSVIVAGPATVSIINSDPHHSLSEFEVSDAEKDETKASFVPPIDYDEVAHSIVSRRFIWIVGPPEAGKRTLSLYLAHSKLPFATVYNIRGTRGWSILSESDVKDSIVILTDPLYLIPPSAEISAAATEFEVIEESETEEDLDLDVDSEPAAAERGASDRGESVRGLAETIHPLKRILDQAHTVIITSSEDLYTKAIENDQLSAYVGSGAFIFELNDKSYGRAERLRLLKKAISLSRRDGEIKQWALKACDTLGGEEEQSNAHPIFREWLPGEICSFVISILETANSKDEIESEFKVPLPKRIYSWFMKLSDESARFFVLARSIFPTLEENALHDKMEEIVNQLKGTYPLTLAPLSVYAYGAAPYISDHRPYRFINDHVLKATTEIVAEYYHRPFGELYSLLKEWSAPDVLLPTDGTEGTADYKRRREPDRLIEESAPIRDAVARMAGKVGRYDLTSVTDLLAFWANHPLGRIGQAAGLALRHTISSEGKCEEAFDLIETWVRTPSSDKGHFRKRSAADALWRMVTAGAEPSQCQQAVRLLAFLAKDQNPYVRRAAAYALSQVVQVHTSPAVKEALELLAKDRRNEVRISLVLGLVSARRNREVIRAWLKEWANSVDSELSRTATLYFLLNWENKAERSDLYERIKLRSVEFRKVVSIAIGLALRRRGQTFMLSLLRHVVNDLAESEDYRFNEEAVVALFKLREAARTYKRSDVESAVQRLVKKWTASSKTGVRLTAFSYQAAATQDPKETLTLLKGSFGPLASSDPVDIRVKVAKWLSWMAAKDREVIYQLLQDWLVTGEVNAITTVVFYWLVANEETEPQRCDYLSSILDHFQPGFAQAMDQAVESLQLDELMPALERLAFHHRATIRKYVATALGRIAAQGSREIYELLEHWLVLGDVNAGATVVLYWLGAGDYSDDQRYDCLKGIFVNFPLVFARGIHDGDLVLDPARLTPRLGELRYLSYPSIRFNLETIG